MCPCVEAAVAEPLPCGATAQTKSQSTEDPMVPTRSVRVPASRYSSVVCRSAVVVDNQEATGPRQSAPQAPARQTWDGRHSNCGERGVCGRLSPTTTQGHASAGEAESPGRAGGIQTELGGETVNYEGSSMRYNNNAVPGQGGHPHPLSLAQLPANGSSVSSESAGRRLSGMNTIGAAG